MALNGFTQGDFITVVLDMDAKTLAFGKNGEVCLFYFYSQFIIILLGYMGNLCERSFTL